MDIGGRTAPGASSREQLMERFPRVHREFKIDAEPPFPPFFSFVSFVISVV